MPPLPGLGTLFEDAPVTSFIGPLVQESTPSIIADKLRQAIAHGELKPGAQLGEAELARKLGVSRGPLREGMQRLTQEGLLVVDPQPRAVRDRHDPRRCPRHVHRAGGDRTSRRAQDPRRRPRARPARSCCTSSTRWPTAETPAEVSELDIAFHERLLQLARSPRLSRMHQTFITETRMCIHALDETYAKSEVRDKEHRALANAIRKGDRELTDRLLTAHMDDAVNRLTHEKTVDGAEHVGI